MYVLNNTRSREKDFKVSTGLLLYVFEKNCIKRTSHTSYYTSYYSETKEPELTKIILTLIHVQLVGEIQF